jgi:tetratricopeptide (TPR) repeat protein
MNETYKKAKKFSYRATEREKLHIEAEYASIIQKDEEKYLKIKQKIADKYPKEKRIHRDLGVYYANKKMFDKALEEFDKALKLDPNYAPVYNHLGYLYSGMGEFDMAIEYFKKYANLSPGDANPFDSMAEIYFVMGNFDEALSKYREALDVKPDFGSEWRIAYIYALMENYTQSIKWIDRYIDKAPSIGIKGVGYKWKWLLNYWIGNYSESFTSLQKATNIYNTLGNSWELANIDWMYAVTNMHLGDIELGREYLKKWSDYWYKQEPNANYTKATYNFRLGLFDLEEDRIDSAEKRLSEMVKAIPELEGEEKERIEVFYNFLTGKILLSRGEYNKVIENMEEIHIFEIPAMINFILLLRYNLPFIRDVKAQAYAEMGELDKAIGEYEKLITIDKKDKDRRLIHPLYHYRLAKIYEVKENKEKAIEQYEKLLQIWKNADESIKEKKDAMVRLEKIKRDI